MTISMIAAMGRNRVIGREGNLPWHLPEDFRFFKRKTHGHPVIMGRKTFDSMGTPLPGRHNIVITRSPELVIPGADVVHSLAEALQLAGDLDEIFIIGGSEIYRQGLEVADRIYLTLVDEEFEGDTFFPEFDEKDWEVTHREDHAADDQNPHAFTFVTYQRRLRPAAG
jgi:dihydrofolate reductase